MTTTVDRVAALEAAAREADGYASLGDAVWRDLERPAPDSAGFFADDRAYVHVARSDNFSPQHWAVGVVVHPDARNGSDRAELLGAARLHIAAHGGGRMVVWIFGASDTDTDLEDVGLHPTRSLHEMRVPLPLAEEPKFPAGITVRTFVPGQDDEAWLEVNNRAFRNHPEQGGWIRETLQRRLAEPWFDPSIFFLAFDEQGLAGSNWCKIHEANGRDPALGEIWVIGVDPRAHGTGLGRALAITGLDAMAQRGLTTGSLFVAADNDPALRLYRSLGFAVHRTDRAYETELEPA